MKNLFLTYAFMLIGTFAYANNSVKEVETKTISYSFFHKKEVVKSYKLFRGNTITVTTSCGNTYDVTFPSSWSTSQILTWVDGFDAGNCP